MAPVADEDDDLPPLVGEDEQALPDDLPPLVQEEEEVASHEPAAIEPATSAEPAQSEATAVAESPQEEAKASGPPDDGGEAERDALAAAAALRAKAAHEAAQAAGEELSAESAIRGAMAEAEEPRPEFKEPDEQTQRMVKAIARDDFEECEVAILAGADVNADCGAGMCALHITALRGEMFLTELLIAHGANLNQRDLSGNTPLLYTCHFYRQHGRGVQLVSQLLYHKADPFYRVKDGKLAGKSAHDLMDKACREPNTDENVPRQMCAMLQLAMDGGDPGYEAITKVWMQHKSRNKRLYEVSSKKDNYDYAMKSIAWETPANAKNAQSFAPVKIDGPAESILEEKFTYLTDYSFTDEGEKVKVYVTFPEVAAEAFGQKGALQVDFEVQTLDLKLKGASESFRLRIEPLFGTIEVEQCKHRTSSSSRKVTLTLVKRHKNRIWSAIQKPR